MTLHWTTTIIYVDVDGGEVITEKEAKQNYTTIKIEKDVKITERYGHTKYTKYCRRKPNQLKLF